MVDGKVDGQILFGARIEKSKLLFGAGVRNGKIYLVPNDSYEKFYLVIKGLSDSSQPLKFSKTTIFLEINRNQ